MLYQIADGITLRVSQRTYYRCFTKPAQEEERERKVAEWEDWARTWLLDPANRSDENYSDIYKELYGYRPRF